MRALSIRQPYVEEILRGIKRIEYRNRRTTIIGERFYIYAALKPGDAPGVDERFAKLGCKPGELPIGLLVGTAKISQCTGATGNYEWHLTDVERLARPRKPKKHPQPSWFNPF